MLNDFDKDELARWFVFNTRCFYCMEYGFDAFHHIMKRTSNSILNACPIHNHKCHLYNGKLHLEKTRISLLRRTFEYLMRQGYVLNKNDIQFIQKNQLLYKKILRGGDN